MRIRHIFTLFFTILMASGSYGQVWTLEKNELYVNLSFSNSEYNKAYDSTGEITELPVSISDITIQLFAQYGLSKKITLQLKVPYKMLTSEGDLDIFNSVDGNYLETGSLNYFGNIEAGALYKFIEDKPMVSLSFFVETNTMDYNYLTGLQTGFNSFGFKPGAGVGWGFNKSWFSYYLGGDIRTNNYSSAILSNLELGYKPVPYLYAAADLFVKRSLKAGGDCDCNNTYTALYLNDQDYIAYALKAGFIFKDWGLNLSYNGAFSAANLPAEGILTVGVQYKGIIFKEPETIQTGTPRF